MKNASRMIWIAVALAACSGAASVGPTPSPGPGSVTGTFIGVFVDGIETGVMSVIVPGVGGAPKATFYLPPFPSNSNLSVTYKPATKPQLTASGGGWTFTGDYSSLPSRFSGGFTGPNGVGKWVVLQEDTTFGVHVTCGSYSLVGSAASRWNLVRNDANQLAGVAWLPNAAIFLSGTVSGTSLQGITSVDDPTLSASGSYHAFPSTGADSTWGTVSEGGHVGTWVSSGCPSV